MDQKRLKQYNAVYLLLTILVPIVLICILGFLGYANFHTGGAGAAACLVCPTLLSVLWWLIGPGLIWRVRKKALARQLDEIQFTRSQTFHGSTLTVVADTERGQIALLFFWNPFEPYILSASQVDRAWTDEGAAGAGFLRGTSRVSFLFLVDGVKIRVNTFTSNQRWKMNDEHVMAGISKADMWVRVLMDAKEAAEYGHGTD